MTECLKKPSTFCISAIDFDEVTAIAILTRDHGIQNAPSYLPAHRIFSRWIGRHRSNWAIWIALAIKNKPQPHKTVYWSQQIDIWTPNLSVTGEAHRSLRTFLMLLCSYGPQRSPSKLTLRTKTMSRREMNVRMLPQCIYKSLKQKAVSQIRICPSSPTHHSNCKI